MTILLVDTDDATRLFMARGFASQGFRVMTATTKPQTLTLTDEIRFKAIVINADLWPENGPEICATLRKNKTTAPIILLSANATATDRIAGLRAGADDFLNKPFIFDELMARIEAVLRRSADYDEKPVRLHVGDLVYDRSTLVVTRANRTISLSSRELSLLELLMSAPGRVFSRTQILSTIWGADIEPPSNTVDVHIGRLRRKIDRNSDDRLIQTVRRRGYRIADRPPKLTSAEIISINHKG